MERKLKHHFIPISYLTAFCDQDGMVWAYKKCLDSEPHRAKPENTAFANKFYALYLDDGSEDTNTFENALADIVDNGNTAGALKGLRSGQPPSFDDRQRLSIFFGFMLVRTPSYRSFYEKQRNKELNLDIKKIVTNKDDFKNWTDSYQSISNEVFSDDEIDQIRKEILNDKHPMEIHSNFILNHIYKLGFDIAKLLVGMRWLLIRAPNNSFFLTSDNPVVVFNPNFLGCWTAELAMKDTEFFIPISKEMGLLIVQSREEKLESQIVETNQHFVNEQNNRIIFMASKFIYASQKSDKIIKMIQNVNSKTT